PAPPRPSPVDLAHVATERPVAASLFLSRGRRDGLRSAAFLARVSRTGAATVAESIPRVVHSPEEPPLFESQCEAARPAGGRAPGASRMNIAFCYESVLPARGGCETYIADLARRLLADRHEVHLYACRWDEQALPEGIVYHELPATRGPRFLRPWRFARRCLAALTGTRHHVTMGFDKTWGQDVLYPQGGLHAASVVHNRNKFATPLMRGLARVATWL